MKTPRPVHSYAILSNGKRLRIKNCKRWALAENGSILIYDNPKAGEGNTVVILPASATLVTNWSHPRHA